MELFLIMGVIFAFLCGIIAKGKGRDALVWGFIGFMTGLIGLIILVCLNDVKDGE